MDIREKKNRLFELYARFDEAAQSYLDSAVCKAGCADCCTNVGNIDAVTLEGLVILDYLRTLPASVQQDFNKGLKENRKLRGKSKYARCAFLLKDNTCGIYAVRPFSCRRLYSLKICGKTGPTVNRMHWQSTEDTLYAIQKLDDTGYSGHIPYILRLLKDAKFRKTYLSDGFSPEDIREFAQKEGIVINRYVEPPSSILS